MNMIDLTEQETTTLRDVVENYLSDLHTEISHTDDRDFRGALRRRQELLQASWRSSPRWLRSRGSECKGCGHAALATKV